MSGSTGSLTTLNTGSAWKFIAVSVIFLFCGVRSYSLPNGSWGDVGGIVPIPDEGVSGKTLTLVILPKVSHSY